MFSFPRLKNLTPTLESTALKLMEEAGELAQAIGKFRGMSGEQTRDGYSTKAGEDALERIAEELFDVAQTATTMAYVLVDGGLVDIDSALERHVQKLIDKGYLKPE
jgi:NTP pyrophosphatase (non-canonical NTP hydrolase)